MAVGEWTKVGTSISLNDLASGPRNLPVLTALENGNYVIVWRDANNTAVSTIVQAQIVNSSFEPIGGPFKINTSIPQVRIDPCVSALPGGGFVVTWADDASNRQLARVYDSSGSALSSELDVGNAVRFSPLSIAGISDDRFLLAANGQTQLFDTAGNTISASYVPNFNGGHMDVSLLADGRYAVSWQQYDQSYEAAAQVFDALGSPVGSVIVVDTNVEQSTPTITGLSNGGFVVAYFDPYPINELRGIKARIYGADGKPVGPEFIVSADVNNPVRALPVVAALPDDRFVVAWTNNADAHFDDYENGILAQVYDASGAKVGSQLEVSGLAGEQQKPEIEVRSDGSFVISWEDSEYIEEYLSTGNRQIKSQRYRFVEDNSAPVANPDSYVMASGNTLSVSVPLGVLSNDTDANPADVLVANLVEGPQHGSLTLSANGAFVYKPTAGFSGTDTFTYSATDNTASDEAVVTISVVAGVTRFGTSGNDTLTGGAGNDTLNGWLGNDTMTGGAGNDLYYVDSLADQVIEAPGGGTDTVRTGISYILADNVENLELIYNGKCYGTGNALANVITGNGSDNVLFGLAGNDTLIGGGGNDTLIGGTGADLMRGGTDDDIYYIDDVGDSTDEIGDQGIDTVRTGLSYTLSYNVENLTLLYNGKCWGTGNELDNVIVGNGADNVLSGLGGHDTLTGGDGADAFVFRVGLFEGGGDTITDFNVAQGDKIWLDHRAFDGLQVGTLSDAQFGLLTDPATTAQKITYDSSTGRLTFTPSGSGYQGSSFAVLDSGLALSASDFKVI